MRQVILQWLTPPDTSLNYNIACKVHQEGTSAWFFESSKFKEWELIGSLLWIHGIRTSLFLIFHCSAPDGLPVCVAGSGKSILWFVISPHSSTKMGTHIDQSTAIITHVISLRDAGLAALAYYYFDFRTKEKRTHLGFVASILTQLSTYLGPSCDILFRLYSTHEKGVQQPSTSALMNSLKEVLEVVSLQPVYIIVDALDECPNTSGWPTSRHVLLEILEDLVDLHIPNLHICVTSRLEADIKDVLEPLGNCVVSLHDESGQQKDISDYVRNVVYSDRRMRKWRDEDKKFVMENISGKADGM